MLKRVSYRGMINSVQYVFVKNNRYSHMTFNLKISLALICLVAFNTVAQTPVTTNFEQVTETAKNYQNRALFFREIPQFNRDSTVIYFDKATALLENLTPVQHQLLAEIYRDIIDRSNRSHPFIIVDSLAAKGMTHFNAIPKKNQDVLLKYDLLRCWAYIKVEEGNLKEAIALFTQALELIQDDKRPEVRAKFLNDKVQFLGRYGNADEKENAHNYLDESIAIYKTLDPIKYATEISKVNKLLFLRHDGTNKDSADYYLSLMKQDLPLNKNPFYHGWVYSIDGYDLLQEKKYDEAQQVLLKGKVLLENYKMTNVDSYVSIVMSLGGLLVEKGEYDEAIKEFTRIREICEANNFIYFGIDALSLISDTYEKKGNYNKALEFYKQYEAENLALETEKNARSLRENELKINVLSQEKQLSQSKQTQLFLMALMITGAILLVLLYRNYRLKQRNNLKLKTLLDKKVSENELLLKEIHHRVKTTSKSYRAYWSFSRRKSMILLYRLLCSLAKIGCILWGLFTKNCIRVNTDECEIIL